MKNDSSGKDVPKLQLDWTGEDYLDITVNTKSLNHLFCAIDQNKINELSEFNNAFEL